jgi:hypothetical protein
MERDKDVALGAVQAVDGDDARRFGAAFIVVAPILISVACYRFFPGIARI